MALTVYGDSTAPLTLLSDAAKDKRRTLRLKFLSKREIRGWQKRLGEAREVADLEARDAAYDKLLEEVVVGWDNIAEPFSIAGISDQYTLPEVMAILDGIPMAMVPGVEDKKK